MCLSLFVNSMFRTLWVITKYLSPILSLVPQAKNPSIALVPPLIFIYFHLFICTSTYFNGSTYIIMFLNIFLCISTYLHILYVFVLQYDSIFFYVSRCIVSGRIYVSLMLATWIIMYPLLPPCIYMYLRQLCNSIVCHSGCL